MQDYVPVSDAAHRAGVSVATMRRAAQRGTIKAVKLGRDWLIYANDIERWVKKDYRPNRAYRYPTKKQDSEDKNP